MSCILSPAKSSQAPKLVLAPDGQDLTRSGKPVPIAPGEVVAERYLVGTLIGEGGMGVVCAATHLGLDVPVAIKLIRPDLKENAEFVQRFLNEAKRAAVLQSEHIARVHDAGQLESGEPYLVMERLEGMELEAYLRQEGPLPQGDAVDLVLQACEGLAEAHGAGIVHRDIKPGNLFLAKRADGRMVLKILDFGISKQLTDSTLNSLTNRDRSLGSPWYMSPEQMMDTSSVDHRADVWSLGVVLFELLTNTRPFDGTSLPEVCAKVLTAPPPLLRERRPDVDAEIEAIIARCLERKPEDRYPDVATLAAALEPFAKRADSSHHRIWRLADGGGRGSASPSGSQDRPTPGSIAPFTGHSRPRTTRSSGGRLLGIAAILASTALLVLAVGPSPRATAQSWWSRAVLPGDPVLAQTDPLPLERDRAAELAVSFDSRATPARRPLAAAPAPLGVTGPEASAPVLESRAPDQPTSESPLTSPGQGELSTGEIRRRLEEYERWLREQGLQRIKNPDTPQPAPDSELLSTPGSSTPYDD